MSQSLYEHVFNVWNNKTLELPQCLVDLLSENIMPYMTKGILRIESEGKTISQFMSNEKKSKVFIVITYKDEDFGDFGEGLNSC